MRLTATPAPALAESMYSEMAAVKIHICKRLQSYTIYCSKHFFQKMFTNVKLCVSLQPIINPKNYKIMAILNRGFDQTNLSGSVGAVTYARVGGVTVARQKVPMHVKARQTRALMLIRMQWANLVAVWKSLATVNWHPSFPKENKRVSDFNMFVSTNMKRNMVYLPKSLVRAGAGVAVAYDVTRGTQRSIAVEFGNNDVPETNLALGTLTIGSSTTVAAFSSAIINNNEDWQDGDQLTLLTLVQAYDAENNVPYLKADAQKITLSSTAATVMLSDVCDVSMLSVVDGCLAWAGSVNGAVAAIHSRIVDGETSCSNQSLVVSNSYASQYQTNAAFLAAANSYGGLAQPQMLTPDIDIYLDSNI